MWNHLKGVARSWFFLTTGEQQALALLLLILFLGALGRWGYTRHYGAASEGPKLSSPPPIETLLNE